MASRFLTLKRSFLLILYLNSFSGSALPRILSSPVIIYLSEISRKSRQYKIMIQEYLPQLLEVCREVRIRGKIAVAIDKHLAVCLEVMMRLD